MSRGAEVTVPPTRTHNQPARANAQAPTTANGQRTAGVDRRDGNSDIEVGSGGNDSFVDSRESGASRARRRRFTSASCRWTMA
jgi:hypothetical protein